MIRTAIGLLLVVGALLLGVHFGFNGLPALLLGVGLATVLYGLVGLFLRR